MNSTAPSPSIMQRFAPPVVALVAAEVTPDAEADQLPGITKAKRLEPGKTYRAVLTIDGVSTPCGSPRTVATVSTVDAGGMVEVSFSSLHPTEMFKAARRFQIQEG